MVKRTDDSAASRPTVVEESVQIGQELIANIQRISGWIDHWSGPDGRVLITKIFRVMIPRKGIECTQFHPTLAQLFGCVLIKTANISSNVRDTKHVELQKSYKK